MACSDADPAVGCRSSFPVHLSLTLLLGSAESFLVHLASAALVASWVVENGACLAFVLGIKVVACLALLGLVGQSFVVVPAYSAAFG